MARLKAVGRLGCALQMLAGGLLMLMGAEMITAELTTMAYWLVDAFPMFVNIG